MLLSALHKMRSWYWTRHYKAGKTLTHFIAKDVGRDAPAADRPYVMRRETPG
jgi:hypothetical protein